MNDILNMISAANTIAIAGHVRPDGDCIGSCMTMYNYIVNQYPDKTVDVYLESVPDNFNYLPRVDQIQTSSEAGKQYDLFISLDCGDLDRLGFMGETFTKAKNTINIDHHISNTKFATVNYVLPNASSTCETLYDVIDSEKIDKEIATAMYTGLIHDTGVFKHSNTSRHTMEVAGVLLEKGVESSKIIDESFYQKTYIQNQLLGRCLLESMLVLNKKCIVSTITHQIMNFYDAKSSDIDGIIDQLRVTKGVEVAILLHELDTQVYKVSMRSNSFVDVSKIAIYFGGGGHIRAAGCTMMGSYYDVINNITELLEKQFEEHGIYD